MANQAALERASLEIYRHLQSAGISDVKPVCEKILTAHTTWDSVCELSVVDFGKLVAVLPISVEDANLFGHYWGKAASRRMRAQHISSPMQFDQPEEAPPPAVHAPPTHKNLQYPPAPALSGSNSFGAAPALASSSSSSSYLSQCSPVYYSSSSSSEQHTWSSSMGRDLVPPGHFSRAPYPPSSYARTAAIANIMPSRPWSPVSRSSAMDAGSSWGGNSIPYGAAPALPPPSASPPFPVAVGSGQAEMDGHLAPSPPVPQRGRKGGTTAKKANAKKGASSKPQLSKRTSVAKTPTSKRRIVHRVRGRRKAVARIPKAVVPCTRPTLKAGTAIAGAQVAVEWDGLWCKGLILKRVNDEVVLARYSSIEGQYWEEWLPIISIRLSSGITSAAPGEKGEGANAVQEDESGPKPGDEDAKKSGSADTDAQALPKTPPNSGPLLPPSMPTRTDSAADDEVRVPLAERSGGKGSDDTDEPSAPEACTVSTSLKQTAQVGASVDDGGDAEASADSPSADGTSADGAASCARSGSSSNHVGLTSRQLLRDQPDDASDVFREPRTNRTDFDRKPLHNRRVQLWWPGPQEWFNGTAKACTGKASQDGKFRIMYDDGDEEVVSESYLRSHRHVYLFPHRPEDDPEDTPAGGGENGSPNSDGGDSSNSKRYRRRKISKGEAAERDEDAFKAAHTPKGGWKKDAQDASEDDLEGGGGAEKGSDDMEYMSDDTEEGEWDLESILEDDMEVVLYLRNRRRWVARLRWKQAWVCLGSFFTKRHAQSALIYARTLMPTHNISARQAAGNASSFTPRSSPTSASASSAYQGTKRTRSSPSLPQGLTASPVTIAAPVKSGNHSATKAEDNAKVSSTTAAASADGDGEDSRGEHTECPAWLLTLLSSTNILEGALNCVARSFDASQSTAWKDAPTDALLDSLVLQRKRPAWSRPGDDSSESDKSGGERHCDVSSSETESEGDDEGVGRDAPLWKPVAVLPRKRGRPRLEKPKRSAEKGFSPVAYRRGVPSSLRVKIDDSFAQALNRLANTLAAELPADASVRRQLLTLSRQLANSMTRTYQLIAGDGAPVIKLEFTRGAKGGAVHHGGAGTPRSRVRFITKAAAARLMAAAQNLRGCFDDSDSSSLRHQAIETNTILEFPECSRAKRRFTEQGQGGSGSVFGSRGQGQLKVADDCPGDIKPALDVVRACLRSDPDPLHDIRFAVDTPVVSDEDSGLFGEFDVIANRDILPGEMGPYSGTVLRDDEVLRHLAKKPRVFLRAMHFWYSVIFEGATGGSTTQSSAVRNTFSIFPFAGNPMALVNDYCGPDRSDTNKAECTDLQNCKYQVVKANGWPYVFLMATKRIPAGHPLRVDYGDAFWDTWHSLRRLENTVDETVRVLLEIIAALADKAGGR